MVPPMNVDALANALEMLYRDIYLAEKLGYNQLVQVESLPFHSEKLPNKYKLLSLLEKGNNDNIIKNNGFFI